jgi:hypothetical protein
MTEDDELDEVLYHTVIDPPGEDNRPSAIGCAIMIVLAAVVLLFVIVAALS